MTLVIEDCKLWGRKGGSLVVEEGRIAAFVEGGTPKVRSDATRISGNGGTVFMGFIDTHCHPFEYGWLRRNLDLKGTSNLTGIRLRLSARARSTLPGAWIAGMGWDQERLSEARMPTRSDIDDVTPNNPVVLTRVCGHIGLLNSRALQEMANAAVGLEGYDLDSRGTPTGIVRESALPPVLAVLPKSEAAMTSDLLTAEVEASKSGLTTLHCIISEAAYQEELSALVGLHSSGSLSLKYKVYIPAAAIGYVEDRRIRDRLNDDKVRLSGVKIYADGSLGARTAALREPYADDPGNSGLLRYSQDALNQAVEAAHDAGFQAVVHAIGDRAVEQALEAISRVSGPGNERRHRIEHASLLPPDLLSRMRKHAVRATVQPLFITSDTWASERLGPERARHLYPLRSMLKAGIIASGSSDSPIESMSPILGMWASMVRSGVAPEEALSMSEAVALYTSNARSNGGDPEEEGLGARADLCLLDSDVEGMHPALLRKVRVSATVVGGEPVYSAS
ncbi:MAG: amidohydrolase [archaeon]|nr:MAG: amidohydrolase [archaeon]